MLSASIVIELGSHFDHSQVIGKKVEYPNAHAELRSTKNGVEIKMTAQDPKSLLSSMGSMVRQITITESVVTMLNSVESKEALNNKRAKTQR